VNGTNETFDEVQNLLPKDAFMIMAAVLIATDAFILFSYFALPVDIQLWIFVVTSVIFAAVILFCWLVKLRIRIENGTIIIRFIKRHVITFEEVIDHKVGDISIIRNFSGWGIKKVSFKNFICVGYDAGVSLKLTGRKVVTVSLSDPEGFASLLPSPMVD